jgi:hypothetical protein
MKYLLSANCFLFENKSLADKVIGHTKIFSIYQYENVAFILLESWCEVRRPAGEKKDCIDLAKKQPGAAHLRNLI